MTYLKCCVTSEVFIITLQEVDKTRESDAAFSSDRLLLTHVIKRKHRQGTAGQQSVTK